MDSQQAMRRCLLLPSSRFRLWWDAVACLLICFIAVVLPYRTAFVTEWSSGWAVIDFVIDLYFLADILINFRTMIVIDGVLITSPTQIFVAYARGWLLLDIIS